MFVFDAFTNSYIVLREIYEERITKGAGDCDKSGYGFYKKISKKYKSINENISVENFNNFPSPQGYFYSYKKNKSDNHIILIGSQQSKVNEYLKNRFTLIYNEEDCYFLSK